MVMLLYKNIKEKLPTIMILSVFILCILFFRSCNEISRLKKESDYERQRTEQNLRALNDTIEFYKTNSGVGFKRAISNMSLDELKEYNPSLYKKIKEDGGKVKTIIHTEMVYKIDESIDVSNYLSDLGNNKYSIEFIHNDGKLYIKGNSLFNAEPYIDDSSKANLIITPDKTQLLDFSLNMELTTGIKYEDGIDKIFVTSSSENVQIVELQGTDVSNYINSRYSLSPPQKRKNFSINISAGYGLVFMGDNQINHGPSFQFGIGYNILNF